MTALVATLRLPHVLPDKPDSLVRQDWPAVIDLGELPRGCRFVPRAALERLMTQPDGWESFRSTRGNVAGYPSLSVRFWSLSRPRRALRGGFLRSALCRGPVTVPGTGFRKMTSQGRVPVVSRVRAAQQRAGPVRALLPRPSRRYPSGLAHAKRTTASSSALLVSAGVVPHRLLSPGPGQRLLDHRLAGPQPLAGDVGEDAPSTQTGSFTPWLAGSWLRSRSIPSRSHSARSSQAAPSGRLSLKRISGR